MKKKVKKPLKSINNHSINRPIFAKNLEGKIIFIRHGETEYNKDLNKKGSKIKYDINYLDGHLNLTGQNKQKKLRNYLKI